MMRPSRTSRNNPLRRTLNVELLEDRTLLNGVVRASLDPSGVLQIMGDNANNQFTIAPSPVAGNIRVSGNRGTFTAINGVTFVDFELAHVSDILMNLGTGKDNVTVTGFSITGDLTINYANADDVFATPDFTAANINKVFAGAGSVPPPSSGGGGSGGSGSGSTLGSGMNGGLLPPVR